MSNALTKSIQRLAAACRCGSQIIAEGDSAKEIFATWQDRHHSCRKSIPEILADPMQFPSSKLPPSDPQDQMGGWGG